MKAIMLSVRPEWVEKILNGEKTIEIRKSMPKGFKGWVYIYETLGKRKLTKTCPYRNGLKYTFPNLTKIDYQGSGKVVARFWFDEYDVISEDSLMSLKISRLDILNKSCLSMEQMLEYWDCELLFAWHIKKLEVFDTPKESREYWYKDKRKGFLPVTKAPQSWQYIEVTE